MKNRREVIGNELLPWNNLDISNRNVYFFVLITLLHSFFVVNVVLSLW